MKRFLAAVILLSATVIVGCSPGKMSVSSYLKENYDEYAVKGRNGILINQKLSFGEYTTSSVKRSWTKGSSMQAGFTDIIWASYEKKKQTFNFQLTNQAGYVSGVYCITKLKSEDLTYGNNPNSVINVMTDLLKMGGYHADDNFAADIFIDKEPGSWQMFIDNLQSQSNAKNYTGFLAKNSSEYYTIVPVTKMEKNGKSGNTLMGSVGFEFRDIKGNAVAAVSTLNNGMVFLGKTTEKERLLLASACAALLLQQSIE